MVLEGGGGLVESDASLREAEKSSQSKAGAQAGSKGKSS